MNSAVVILCSVLYLLLLFFVAYKAERYLQRGKSIIKNPYVYALSLCVYCTAWTYYGSVGRATTHGIGFLAIYLGPTIAAGLWGILLRKIIRISKIHRINSLADFISTRYGKDFSLAAIVTTLCVIGVIPYISLQLKAISLSFDVLSSGNSGSHNLFFSDTTFYSAVILGVFIILFGTRSVDATEKHEGLVAAIAFESVVKLGAFLIAGIFITYGIFHGLDDIIEKAASQTLLQRSFSMNTTGNYVEWFATIVVSMFAVLLLPRQFQVSVIENIEEDHIKKATWIFPLYMFAINIFVVPIAFAGIILFGTSVDPDTFVLAIPLAHHHTYLGLLVFIGGFSAATSMIIVETIAISTMVSNNIMVPVLLNKALFRKVVDTSLSRTILLIRRMSIILILLMAFLYDIYIAQYFSLVSIGLVSFAAVTQFAPALFIGLYWRGATKNAALIGMSVGFFLWFYTLIIPSMVSAHLLNESIITEGLFGIAWMRPTALFGLTSLDSFTHSVFWSLLFNTMSVVGISLFTNQSSQEIYQAKQFVDVFSTPSSENAVFWRGIAYVGDLFTVLENFIGKDRAKNVLTGYANRYKIPLNSHDKADPRLVQFSEKILAGVIGSASARIIVKSITKEEELSIDEVLEILHESQNILILNKELRKKTIELTKATEELRKVNEQLKNMDTVKDEFLYTVTHELRTPLTSIRSLSEIVHDNPDLDTEQRQEFLSAIVKETERLSHLITQVLTLEKYESGKQTIHYSECDFSAIIRDVIELFHHSFLTKSIEFHVNVPETCLMDGDEVLLRQVIENLVSNAVKFTPAMGTVSITLLREHSVIRCSIADTGKGIPDEVHELIFDKFFQAKNQTVKKPVGTGLGLAICRRIIEMHDGKIWVEKSQSPVNHGAVFSFYLPRYVSHFEKEE